MMFPKFILIFCLTFSTFDSAIHTKLRDFILHTADADFAGTDDDVRIALHSNDDE